LEKFTIAKYELLQTLFFHSKNILHHHYIIETRKDSHCADGGQMKLAFLTVGVTQLIANGYIW